MPCTNNGKPGIRLHESILYSRNLLKKRDEVLISSNLYNHPHRKESSPMSSPPLPRGNLLSSRLPLCWATRRSDLSSDCQLYLACHKCGAVSRVPCIAVWTRTASSRPRPAGVAVPARVGTSSLFGRWVVKKTAGSPPSLGGASTRPGRAPRN